MEMAIYIYFLCFLSCIPQIEEGIVLRVAGGLIIEHPLVLPYIKEVVGFLILMQYVIGKMLTEYA